MANQSSPSTTTAHYTALLRLRLLQLRRQRLFTRCHHYFRSPFRKSPQARQQIVLQRRMLGMARRDRQRRDNARRIRMADGNGRGATWASPELRYRRSPQTRLVRVCGVGCGIGGSARLVLVSRQRTGLVPAWFIPAWFILVYVVHRGCVQLRRWNTSASPASTGWQDVGVHNAKSRLRSAWHRGVRALQARCPATRQKGRSACSAAGSRSG